MTRFYKTEREAMKHFKMITTESYGVPAVKKIYPTKTGFTLSVTPRKPFKKLK